MTLVESIQTIARNVLNAERPAQLVFGTVISKKDQPLRVRISEKIVLDQTHLIRADSTAYEKGTVLSLLRDHGGQRFFVLEGTDAGAVLARIVHEDLSGREDPGQHPIGAVDNLREELDGRLVDVSITNQQIEAMMEG